MSKKFSKAKPIQTPAKIGFLGYLGDLQGCGHIRVIFPYLLLNHFKTKDVIVFAQYISQYMEDPGFYKSYTFVQFQRSATDAQLEVFKHFKSHILPKRKIPLIYEIDDLILGIPEWNFASDYYKKYEDNIKKMLDMSDGVSASTLKLKEIYSKYNKNISVVPNHLCKFIWGEIYPKHLNEPRIKKPRIIWAGSQNHFTPKHREELKGGDFGEKLLHFIRKTVDIYDWCLMGAMPNELRDVSKIKFQPWANIFQYPSTLKSYEPDICIAPLENNLFNSCKSNIKQLEYTACGAASVYSNIFPYRNCELKADNDEEMISYIEKLASDVDYRGQIWSRDKERVNTQLFWEEHDNIKKYINTYLKMFGNKLP